MQQILVNAKIKQASNLGREFSPEVILAYAKFPSVLLNELSLNANRNLKPHTVFLPSLGIPAIRDNVSTLITFIPITKWVRG